MGIVEEMTEDIAKDLGVIIPPLTWWRNLLRMTPKKSVLRLPEYLYIYVRISIPILG